MQVRTWNSPVPDVDNGSFCFRLGSSPLSSPGTRSIPTLHSTGFFPLIINTQKLGTPKGIQFESKLFGLGLSLQALGCRQRMNDSIEDSDGSIWCNMPTLTTESLNLRLARRFREVRSKTRNFTLERSPFGSRSRQI